MAPNPVPLSPRRLASAGLKLKPMESAFKEGSAIIVMPSTNTAFFNPVQEFNRDLSVLAIKTWSEMMNEDLKAKWERKTAGKQGSSKKQKRGENSGTAEGKEGESSGSSNKRVKIDGTPSEATNHSDSISATASAATAPEASLPAATTTTTTASASSSSSDQASTSASAPSGSTFRPHKFTLLEALSATGLRSIRYARELPLLKYVVANDLSAGAIKAMKRNIALNFPADRPIEEWIPEKEEATDEMSEEDKIAELENGGPSNSHPPSDASMSTEVGDAEASAAEAAIHPDCRIRPNEGDAMDVMYSHRKLSKRFDVVDLDPYGTAAPFIDGAVQSVADGGLLCVTCTDSAVLASNSWPEKAFALYGGSCTKAEYSHEIGIRLVLHMISSAAAKYGRYIEPQLSLSIDFYMRVFIKVNSGPARVKNLASQTGIVYTCSYCANFHSQHLGRATKSEGKNNVEHVKHQNGSGPPVDLGSTCSECGSRYQIAGPMWLDPIHNPEFCNRLLETLEREPAKSNTAPRIRGMVGIASQEISDSLFYFLPQKVTGLLHCSSPSFLQTTSALLNAGYKVSRSHTIPGSIKTDAPRGRVIDLMRSWIDQVQPIKKENLKEKSPSKFMNDKSPVEVFDMKAVVEKYHPEALILAGRGQGDQKEKKKNTVKYQNKLMPNWGPGKAAPMH
ncbi:unnamed protein product [Sympodiomycopsis kandeliae]